MGLTEDEARQFAEEREARKAIEGTVKALNEELAAVKAKAATEEEARKAAESAAVAASERVAALVQESNRRTLSEFVRENRLAFQGEVPDVVTKLEKLQGKLGDDFGEYLGDQKSLHERIKASGMFDTKATSSPVTAAGSDFETLVAKAMSENAGMTKSDATSKVARENPALYAQYDRAFKASIRRGGE